MADVISQTVMNAVFCVLGFLLMFMLNSITASIKDLRAADARLADSIVKLSEALASFQCVVAGQYVTNERLERLENALFRKLDRIEDQAAHRQSRRVDDDD